MRVISLSLLLSLGLLQANSDAAALPAASLPVVKAVHNFDIDRYMGKWYEIARLPAKAEKDCIAPVVVDYTHSAKQILVKTTCASSTTSGISFNSVVLLRDKNFSGDGHLCLSTASGWLRWLPLWQMDLEIIYTDYMYAIIGSPDQHYLWIYSRQENPPAKDLENLVNFAKRQGFDNQALIYDYPAANNN